MIKKIFSIVLWLLVIASSIHAQQKVIQLYNGPIQGSESWTWNEDSMYSSSWKSLVIYNVSKPSLTVYKPDASIANGTAVIICPGGGFMALSMDNEGYGVAQRLVKTGITCFVLKYRLAHVLSKDPVKEFLMMPCMMAIKRSKKAKRLLCL